MNPVRTTACAAVGTSGPAATSMPGGAAARALVVAALLAALVTTLLAATTSAAAADARDRGFLSKGMPEGEVVFKIGKPDHEAFVANARGQPEEKTWTYFPHARDPQTLTIVTLRAGVVTGIERKIAR